MAGKCQGRISRTFTDRSDDASIERNPLFVFMYANVGIYEALIRKLPHCGVTGRAFHLLKLYLIKRIQRVDFNGMRSSEFVISMGVPQAPILGPDLPYGFLGFSPGPRGFKGPPVKSSQKCEKIGGPLSSISPGPPSLTVRPCKVRRQQIDYHNQFSITAIGACRGVRDLATNVYRSVDEKGEERAEGRGRVQEQCIG
ncbi:hypothetical protein EVAR_86817_1 [Eumeta japonica]|uniref:Uncharacterized protein n=1 Tax=Eumeta variegata TaxID=151549 RepID=A0A4C1VVG8_EUMVA|nr:hypothetical protein EVAR_86817_1 [Eumeta japonica]